MIANAVVAYLRQDEQLKALLQASIYDSRIYPLFTSDLSKPSLVYTDAPSTLGYVGNNRIEFRVIASDYDTALEIEKELQRLLDFKDHEKSQLFNGITFRSALNGGGTQEGPSNFIERTNIFNVIWKRSEI